MRLCRFDAGAGPRHGIVEDGYVVDRDDADERHPLEEIRLLAPALPRKFLAIGLNYADHIAESGMEAPEYPVFFNKQVTCVVGPDDDVHMPRVSNLLDYEGELAIVIGTRCRHVPEDRAHEVIAGYTITNDVSVRDWQLRTPTMTMGKSFDTHGPLGPWIVTADELGDPHDLGDPDLRQRRAAPGRQHGRDDLQLLPAGRPSLAGVHARAGRRDRDRHAGRHRRRATAVPRGTAQGRRRGADRDRRDRRARATPSSRSPTASSCRRARRRRNGRTDRRAARVPRRQSGRRARDTSLPTGGPGSRSCTSRATASAC